MADANEVPGPAAPVDLLKSDAVSVLQRKGTLWGATALLSCFVWFQAPALWDEWQGLRRDWEQSRISRPMGYIGISPNPSYAQPPTPYIREEGGSMFLWSGWTEGVGHGWFRVGAKDLDLGRLSKPMGRDVVRAIDRPIVERGGGAIWDRMLTDAPVVGLTVGGAPTAYPMLLLSKVEVVNDAVGDHPVLVVSTPFLAAEETVDVYHPVVGGKRVRFGSSGYFVTESSVPRPLLYDQETESLWMVKDHQLSCVAGACKGMRLRHLERGEPVPWDQWSETHPEGRLIVGAERPQLAGPRVDVARK